MHLLSLVFGFALLPEAYTLKCYECGPGIKETCANNVRECPSKDQQCGAVRIASQTGKTFPSGILQADLHMKSCFTADQCLEGSVNYGTNRTLITTKCCTSDLCNTDFAPGGRKSQPNGKKCYTCIGQMCTKTLDCEGDEDYCISSSMKHGNAQAGNMKGCASKRFSSYLDEMEDFFDVDFSVCLGDLCNSASSPRVGLLLLLTAPLLTSVMLC
ncbi:urokinase plasminogen activator surface receptor-like [Cheilinus undulatus]|uniref:urokinase plasminogen activator surface receptor-like n=1 Tax=Cheilinus undulatus TaxID=241271 RepID=UPI001BD57451|nr:urokinase plasminogen activator surface receptor-like [Cheilinus undulatus]